MASKQQEKNSQKNEQSTRQRKGTLNNISRKHTFNQARKVKKKSLKWKKKK